MRTSKFVRNVLDYLFSIDKNAFNDETWLAEGNGKLHRVVLSHGILCLFILGLDFLWRRCSIPYAQCLYDYTFVFSTTTLPVLPRAKLFVCENLVYGWG